MGRIERDRHDPLCSGERACDRRRAGDEIGGGELLAPVDVADCDASAQYCWIADRSVPQLALTHGCGREETLRVDHSARCALRDRAACHEDGDGRGTRRDAVAVLVDVDENRDTGEERRSRGDADRPGFRRHDSLSKLHRFLLYLVSTATHSPSALMSQVVVPPPPLLIPAIPLTKWPQMSPFVEVPGPGNGSLPGQVLPSQPVM